MQDSLKIEYTRIHHRRDHNVSETTQASFLAKFEAIRNTWPEKTSLQCSKDIMPSTIHYKIQITNENSYSVKFKTCPLKK